MTSTADQLDTASQAFGTLAAQHGDSGRRRLVALITTIVLAISILLAITIDFIRTKSARRYAHELRGERSGSRTCDSSLARRRFWFGPVVSGHEFCSDHDLSSADHEQIPQFSFLVVGDWGRDGMCCQHDVATEMSILSARTNPQFIVGAGDNFYEAGIEHPSDGQVDRSWRQVYIHPHKSLQKPWKMILGNHDYEGDVQAQVKITSLDKYWEMPSTYYFQSFLNNQIFIAFIDTSCLYYTADQRKKHFKGQGITDEYRVKQLTDLKDQLENSTAPWKIVIGHHPFYSGSDDARVELELQESFRALLAPIFKEARVATYISGHEHLMEHYDADGFHTFVSGAGSKVRSVSLRQPKSVFSLGKQGFLQVALMKDSKELLMRFFDFTGAIPHTTRIPQPK